MAIQGRNVVFKGVGSHGSQFGFKVVTESIVGPFICGSMTSLPFGSCVAFFGQQFFNLQWDVWDDCFGDLRGSSLSCRFLYQAKKVARSCFHILFAFESLIELYGVL